MIKLMKEIPSPNVTRIVEGNWPMRSVVGSTMTSPIESIEFDVECHEKGVFVYKPRFENVDDHWLRRRAPSELDAAKKHNDHIKQKCHTVETEVRRLFSIYNQMGALYPVGVTGLKDSNASDVEGSKRFCNMDPAFATMLTTIINKFPTVNVIQDSDNNWWEMVNVSQYFRFMWYKKDGQHFPHYDSDYEYQYNNTVTKYSLVVYFTDCNSGEIAFCHDHRPITESNNCTTDWDRQANDDEIWLKIRPSAMKIVLFPHDLCHTVLPFTDVNNDRLICRGDILFRKI